MRQKVVPGHQGPLATVTQGGSLQKAEVCLGMRSRPSKAPVPMVRSKGQQHGTILTGGLPVSFLAVRAVVYVDIWGLLLLHSNTAETGDTDITSGQKLLKCFPRKVVQHPLLTIQNVAGVKLGTVAHGDGMRALKWGGGRSRKASPCVTRRGRRKWPSFRPASMRAITALSPQSPGKLRERCLRDKTPPSLHHRQSAALCRTPLGPMRGLLLITFPKELNQGVGTNALKRVQLNPYLTPYTKKLAENRLAT